MFSHELPYSDAEQWPFWLPEQRRQLPQPWPATGMRRQATNGDELELRGRLVEFDPLEQRLKRQLRATLRREGRVIAEEEHTLHVTLYFRNELLLLLAQAGFGTIDVRGGYAEAAPTAEDTTLVFIARKDG